MEFLREYGVATHIYIPIVKRAVVDFALGADWSPAAGDVKISKDGGAAANVTNLPAAIAMGNVAMWDFSLTATEMQAAQIMVTVGDAATKAVEDQFFTIATYGNASARHKANLNDSVRLGLTALPNAAAEAAGGLYTRGSGAGQINQPGNGLVDVSLKAILNTALTETAGQIAAAFKQFFNVATPTGTVNSLPSAAPAANGGLPTVNASNQVKANLEQWSGTNVAAPDTAGYPKVTIKSGTGAGELSISSGIVGASLSAAERLAIWDIATTLLTTVGSIGKRIVDNLDAAMSSRAPSATALSTAQWTNGRATNLDNLDAAVSSRSTLGGTAQTGDVYAALTGAQAEPAAVPAANASPLAKLGYVFAKVRNKRLTTATADTLRNDADSADVATATLSDDGTTFTKGKDT